MDIRLKKYRYSVWFKLLAVILCVAGMLTIAYGFLKAPYFKYALNSTNFENIIREDLGDVFLRVSEVAFKYKNEEYIKSGAVLSEEYIKEKKDIIISERENAVQQINNKYNELIEMYNSDETAVTESKEGYSGNSEKIFTYPEVATESNSTDKSSENKLSDRLIDEKNKEVQDVIVKYDEKIKAIKADGINEQLKEYRNMLEVLEKITGVYYTVVENNEVRLSRVKNKDAAAIKAFYDNLGRSDRITKDNAEAYFSNTSYRGAVYIPDNTIVYLGITEDKYNEELTAFNKNTSEGLFGIKLCTTGLLVFFAGLIYVIYSAGRRTGKDGIHLISMDFAYLDVSLLLAVGAIFVCMSPIYQAAKYFWDGKTYINNSVIMLISSVVITIGTLIGILYVSMFTKRAKRHEVIKHTFIYSFCKWILVKFKSIWSAFNTVFDRSPLAIKLVLFFTAYAFSNFIGTLILTSGDYMGAFIGLVLIAGVNAAAVYYLLKLLKTFTEIKNGAERIRAGELNYTIPEQGAAELRQLSETINKMGDGLKNAMDSKVKSERMKTELITNVSHDLKTPLTSIITYVDLLKKEGLQSENAGKYLNIIDAKSLRLKALTEDLFEAAKATSGNITVNAETLDVVSLLRQGLGELSDKIEASGLIFRTNFSAEKLFVFADGKLLWRVIENLISNALKYALTGSRVYLDISEASGQVTFNIKNISAYELNVDEEELMERFKRGDASRHSEGSGLGLSIAKSLMELQGGNFHIEIDGDLFKAIIVLPEC